MTRWSMRRRPVVCGMTCGPGARMRGRSSTGGRGMGCCPAGGRPPRWTGSDALLDATSTAALADGQRDAVIHTEGLTKVYPGTDFAAVDRLNLDVEAGEIFGLLGPNGAGKTTTAGMLTTRVVPTSGKAIVGGIDVVAYPALAKQAIGVVTQ